MCLGISWEGKQKNNEQQMLLFLILLHSETNKLKVGRKFGEVFNT